MLCKEDNQTAISKVNVLIQLYSFIIIKMFINVLYKISVKKGILYTNNEYLKCPFKNIPFKILIECDIFRNKSEVV